ncbi:MAG: phasin family protein [Gammaproteobacteria bacterium]|nr:phasin family protein [Gammaproteobacteria bacterium]MDH3769114.1 phasin family protein [Gammaproteobacteria bacterium]
MQENNVGGRISSRVRQGLDNGASWVSDRKGPLDVATEKTLKLNGISHESTARMVRQQARFIESSVEGAALRLKTAAKSDSFRDLIDGQIKLLPETRDRIVDDIRKTVEILSDTREDLGQLFRETLTDLRGESTVGDSIKESVDEVTDKVAEAVEDVA